MIKEESIHRVWLLRDRAFHF